MTLSNLPQLQKKEISMKKMPKMGRNKREKFLRVSVKWLTSSTPRWKLARNTRKSSWRIYQHPTRLRQIMNRSSSKCVMTSWSTRTRKLIKSSRSQMLSKLSQSITHKHIKQDRRLSTRWGSRSINGFVTLTTRIIISCRAWRKRNITLMIPS